jgi:NADH:ubiquinone oxidoreductase subunit 6 (subunit J)
MMMINTNYLFVRKSGFVIDNLYFFIFILFFVVFEYLITSVENTVLNFAVVSNIWVSNITQYFINDIFLFGEFLYLHFFYFTVLIALILLVGMIGSIALCLSDKGKLNTTQDSYTIRLFGRLIASINNN